MEVGGTSIIEPIVGITGCMGAGKTELIIKLQMQALRHNKKTQVFKPDRDTRSDLNKIVSHSGYETEAISIRYFQPEDIFTRIEKGTEIIYIDEGQLFTSKIVPAVYTFALQGIKVRVAGLNKDFRGEPFEPMDKILAIATTVINLLGKCTVCGDKAVLTQRLRPDGKPASYYDPIIQIGGLDTYQPVCFKHHKVENDPRKQFPSR